MYELPYRGKYYIVQDTTLETGRLSVMDWNTSQFFDICVSLTWFFTLETPEDRQTCFTYEEWMERYNVK